MTASDHIVMEGLTVRYGPCKVLLGVDLTVQKGEFVSVVGKSGSGKSTLLHALAGFIESTGNIQRPSNLGMVFQNYAVYPWLTVRENLAFGLQAKTAAERAQIVSRFLDIIELREHAVKYPTELSGGQSQRVALGRALAPNPEAILMDEPFGALDLYTREKMQTWLLDIWAKEHQTVIFVTHSIEEAIFLSDRVVVMAQGLVCEEFPVPFPRPRREDLKFYHQFVELKKQILESMEGTRRASALPD